MIGKRYYLTELDAWRRHAPRCAESHYIVLNGSEQAAETKAEAPGSQLDDEYPKKEKAAGEAQVLVLISADEAAHIAIENDAEFEPLPHPLSRRPISERAAAALAHFGVEQGNDAFTVAEKVARVHPLLRHRVF